MALTLAPRVTGYDSAAPINAAAAKAAGASFVGRYVSDFVAKNITAGEYHGYLVAGLAVILFAENDQNDWSMTPAEATAFGKRCRAAATAAGFQADRPIFASIDTDLVASQFPQALTYVTAFTEGAGGPPSAYAENALSRYLMAHGVKFTCITAGWNDGGANIAQVDQTVKQITIAGTTVDVDNALTADYGQSPWTAPTRKASDMFLFRNPAGPEQYLALGRPAIHLGGPDYLNFLKAGVIEVPVTAELFLELTTAEPAEVTLTEAQIEAAVLAAIKAVAAKV